MIFCALWILGKLNDTKQYLKAKIRWFLAHLANYDFSALSGGSTMRLDRPGLPVCRMEHAPAREPPHCLCMTPCTNAHPCPGDSGGRLQKQAGPAIILCEGRIEHAPGKDAVKSAGHKELRSPLKSPLKCPLEYHLKSFIHVAPHWISGCLWHNVPHTLFCYLSLALSSHWQTGKIIHSKLVINREKPRIWIHT